MDKTFAVYYLTEARERVVGRIDWIYGLDLAKTLNNRINRNQTITIFWSKDLKKNPCFVPSSNVQFRHVFDANVDSIYQAKILKCFGTERDAIRYKNFFRNGVPALYNNKRLLEKPGAKVIRSNNNGQVRSQRIVPTVIPASPTITVVHCKNTSRAQIRNNQPLVDNNRHYELDDAVICVSPECDFIVHSPTIEFTHRKIDIISSHIGFELKPDGSRIYTIDGHKRTLPPHVVKMLKLWNSAPPHLSSEDIDKKFVEILMICVIGTENLLREAIDKKLRRFVQDLYNFRVNKDERRFSRFTEYFETKCLTLKKSRGL